MGLAALVGLTAKESLAVGRAGAKSILILGSGRLAGRLQRELANTTEVGGRRLEPDLLDPCRAECGAEYVKQLILSRGVSDVVVADWSVGTREDLTSLLIEFRFHGVRVSRAPEFYEDLHKKVWLESLRPEVFVYSDALGLSRRYRVLKRVFDLGCALALLALTLPLMLLIALAIKLESRGPILFRQERIGQFGVPFTLYKFRSMRNDAEEDTGPVWAEENDERVTHVGWFLRRAHLDELPQVINVLNGSLSFVGPRPERRCFVRMLRQRIPYYRLREYIQPGITGWAQVSFAYGGSVEAAAEKLQYDLYYARHASFSFDVKVLLYTVWHVVFGRGR